MSFSVTPPVAQTTANLASPPAGVPDERTRLGEVAQQFEAIFLRQMLDAARNADLGGDDLFGGQSDDTFKEMRDAHFAELASQSGMIGLAPAIEAQLANYIGGKA